MSSSNRVTDYGAPERFLGWTYEQWVTVVSIAAEESVLDFDGGGPGISACMAARAWWHSEDLGDAPVGADRTFGVSTKAFLLVTRAFAEVKHGVKLRPLSEDLGAFHKRQVKEIMEPSVLEMVLDDHQKRFYDALSDDWTAFEARAEEAGKEVHHMELQHQNETERARILRGDAKDPGDLPASFVTAIAREWPVLEDMYVVICERDTYDPRPDSKPIVGETNLVPGAADLASAKKRQRAMWRYGKTWLARLEVVPGSMWEDGSSAGGDS